MNPKSKKETFKSIRKLKRSQKIVKLIFFCGKRVYAKLLKQLDIPARFKD